MLARFDELKDELRGKDRELRALRARVAAVQCGAAAVDSAWTQLQADLVVAELGTGSVVRLDAGSGDRTTIATGLFVPTGLAASEDDLWVADWATGVVWQIVADGQVLDEPAAVAAGSIQPEVMALD